MRELGHNKIYVRAVTKRIEHQGTVATSDVLALKVTYYFINNAQLKRFMRDMKFLKNYQN